MAIELNKVGIEIDGKVYQFYKLSFGFQRKLIEVQSNLNKLQNEVAKKYGIPVEGIVESKEVTDTEKLQIATAGMELQGVLASLFVNKDEADVLDNFDESNIGELILALQ